jgi:hypothetical protein
MRKSGFAGGLPVPGDKVLTVSNGVTTCTYFETCLEWRGGVVVGHRSSNGAAMAEREERLHAHWGERKKEGGDSV